MSEESKINLFVTNNTAYIWTSDDWTKMRSNRVSGYFVGSLAALPRQDAVEGLPLALLPEEATLLVEKGLAQLLEVPSLSQTPVDHVREESQRHRKEILSEQIGLLKDLRKKEIERNIDQIVAGKIIKNKLPVDSTNESTNLETLKQKILKTEFDKVQDPKTSTLSVEIFTGDPWIKSEECVLYDWRYPETDKEKLHYLTYKDLWERGYYITSGHKFGADYLVYPGDPAKFHSFFIVICTRKDSEFRPYQIISYGRLAQSVRKTFVLAYLSDDDTINYQSIQWTGQ